jgi:hypothetical protein
VSTHQSSKLPRTDSFVGPQLDQDFLLGLGSKGLRQSAFWSCLSGVFSTDDLRRAVSLLSTRDEAFTHAYRLHGWTAWTAASPEVSCRLYKVRSTDTLALVLIVFSQQEVAIALQRIIDASGNLSIVQKQRAVCAAAGRTVRLVLGRVTGCARLISPRHHCALRFKQLLTGIMESESDRISCKSIATDEVRLQVCGYVVPDLWARSVGCRRAGLFQCRSPLRYEGRCLRVRICTSLATTLTRQVGTLMLYFGLTDCLRPCARKMLQLCRDRPGTLRRCWLSCWQRRRIAVVVLVASTCSGRQVLKGRLGASLVLDLVPFEHS